MKKTVKLFLLIAAALACLCASACADTEIDLAAYLSAGYSGVNGEGCARAHFDYSAFEYDVMSLCQGEDGLMVMQALTAFENSIRFDPETVSGLSNGDVFSIRTSFDSSAAAALPCRFTASEKSFTADCLTDAVAIDPFAPDIFGRGMPVSWELEGVDPFICLYLRNDAGLNDPVSHISYRADKDWQLKNGDTITITASMSENLARQGYVLSRTETTLTVTGFDRYAGSAADLPEETLRAMAQRAQNECISDGSVNIWEGYNNMTPWGARIENIRTGDTALLLTRNYPEEEYSFLLVPVYKTISTDEWYDMETGANTSRSWEDVFAYYKFSRIAVHPDGSVSWDESYVEMNGCYTDAATADTLYLNNFRSDFTFTEIPMPR